MGDFNNRSDIKDEGYNLILKDKWYDLYELAQIRDEGITSLLALLVGFLKIVKLSALTIFFAIKKNKCTISKIYIYWHR